MSYVLSRSGVYHLHTDKKIKVTSLNFKNTNFIIYKYYRILNTEGQQTF